MIGYLTNEMAMLWSTPITLFFILLEMYISNRYNRGYYKTADTKQNAFLALSFFIVDSLTKVSGFLMLSVFYRHGFNIAPDNSKHIGYYWLALLLAEDFFYWFMHLMDHKIRFLWAGHIHHHSSREFNFSVGIRSAVFEPIEKFFFFIPLAIIGFRPIDIVLIYILTQGWGTFLHTRMVKKLGVLEKILITPSHHRVHHGRNIKYLDKNFGMFLIIWDKLFGTFQAEDEMEPVDFGLVKNIEYKNYLDIIFYEIKLIIKDTKQNIPLTQKMKYIFGPPGYSHDGSRKTSKQLQKERLR